MSIITFDTTLRVSKLNWGRADQDVIFRGPFGVQTMNVAEPLWKANVVFDLLNESEAGAYQSLIMQLDGARHNLALWNIGRPAPRGTMRGSPTLAAAAAAGDTSLSLTNAGQGSTTLLPGDYLGLGSGAAQQVVMVTSAVTLSGGGTATVQFKPALRAASSSGAAITWDKPMALFRQQVPTSTWDYERTTTNGLTLDLLEDWRP